jgi:hypothetical protein
MSRTLKMLAAGVLGISALTAYAPSVSAQINCYYLPKIRDCVDLTVDCGCIIIRGGARAESEDKVIDQGTLYQAIGW